MFQLIETIKILNGNPQNLIWHQRRFEEGQQALNQYSSERLSEIIFVPLPFQKGLVKCRITYNQTVQNIEFFHYQRKLITSLKVVHDDKINYNLKFKERTHLNKLHEKKTDCDEVLIIKNNLITDTTYANVVLEKNGLFFTPDSPLLKGTKRAELLEKGIIQEQLIQEKNLRHFDCIHLINAMMDLGECVIPIPQIFNQFSLPFAFTE